MEQFDEEDGELIIPFKRGETVLADGDFRVYFLSDSTEKILEAYAGTSSSERMEVFRLREHMLVGAFACRR